MATETIYGCVTSSGGVIFKQDTCEYPACLELTGTHAGQVAVTIETLFCDDTFYGCVDFATGKFEVVVPDDCCNTISGTGCAYCVEDNTPIQIQVTFAGISDCYYCDDPFGWCTGWRSNVASHVNGSHTLTRGGGASCSWGKQISSPTVSMEYGETSSDLCPDPCDGVLTNLCTDDWNEITISAVRLTSDEVRVTVTGSYTTPTIGRNMTFLIFSGTDSVNATGNKCFGSTVVDNDYTSCFSAGINICSTSTPPGTIQSPWCHDVSASIRGCTYNPTEDGTATVVD